MKAYRNVIICGEQNVFVSMFYEYMNTPVKYVKYSNMSHGGVNSTAINSLKIINKFLAQIYKSNEASPHYFVIPSGIYKAIINGTYKNWVKTGKTASGRQLTQDELCQWTIFASLYKALFNEINFKPLSYYSMKNPKYNVDQMKYTKSLINKAYEYIDKNKNNNFIDTLEDLL